MPGAALQLLVRARVRRRIATVVVATKADAADCAMLLAAARAAGVPCQPACPTPVRSPGQESLSQAPRSAARHVR
jgi:hypothetical protein